MADAKLKEKTSENEKQAKEKISDAKSSATDKNASAQKSANTDIRDANYKTAIEKCDAYAGDVKNNCIADAKQRFGK
jgi:hypothetical protein